ncbi:MAG: acyltransferase family protein [Microbacterium sp.]|uniref:acyltransferase family protein n=1 Tax=Microbacterium sp. TaxID=51671 RepID=UPI003F7EA934
MDRNAGIDLVRSVGVLAIVAGHVWLDEPAHSLLFAWHVPVFFFLSGYLWKRRTIRAELAARSRTLLKPYAFWFVLLLAVFIAVRVAQRPLTLGAVAGPIYGGIYATQPFSTFWFVFSLFAAALLWQLLNGSPRWIRATVLVLAVACTVFAGPELARTPLAIGTSLPALVFVAAGTWAREFETRHQVRPWLAAIALLVAGSLVVTHVSAPVDIKAGVWGTPLLSAIVGVTISWSAVVLAMALCRRASLPVSALITGFALCGFTIILAHPAVLWLCKGSGIPLPAVFGLAVIVPAAISLAAQRTAASQWVTGVPRRRASPDMPVTGSRSGAAS